MDAVKKILVPTDFSASAKNALEYAIAVAQQINATLLIVHVFYIPGITARAPYIKGHDYSTEEYHAAEEKLRQLVLEIPALKTVPYESKVISAYWPIEFPEVINAEAADLIIMGTSGASGIKKIIIGSSTASMMEASVLPVLAIPLPARFTPIQKIGLAIDLQPIENLGIFDPLLWLARALEASIQIFHVQTEGGSFTKTASETETVDALLRHLSTGTNSSFTLYYGETIEEGIYKYITAKHIDLLVMTNRKRSFFQSLFTGSLTKKMSFHTKTPLLVIPESKPQPVDKN
jgi:nucleotide-binding universal stress UspA family protein